MPDQQLPEPILVSRGPFDPAAGHPAPPSVRPRCRALTTDGHRCKNYVLGGLHLCFSHYRNRRPALPEPQNVSVPLLEDRSAIQLMTTQILHGILSNRLEPARARVALYALYVAALTVPRPPREQPSRPQPSRRQTAEAASPEAFQPDPTESSQQASADAFQSDTTDDSVCRLGRDHEDFISADGDLDASPLNPSCTVAESAEAAHQLLKTLQPRNHCDPALDIPDPLLPDPSHDSDRCACFTCADYRAHIDRLTAKIRSG